MRDLCFDFSGFSLRLSGLPSSMGGRLAGDWGAFAVEAPVELSMAIDVVCDPATAYDRGVPFSPKLMRGELHGDAADFVLPEGRVVMDANGAGALTLFGEPDGRRYFALMNLLRAAIAWCLPRQGMLMLHAAGLRFGDHAFLLIGSEGCGKSTWVRNGIEGGGEPISDDIVLVDTSFERPQAMGSPFRSTQKSDYRPGRWGIGSFLLPRWGDEVALVPASALNSQSALVSNLPFVAEALSRPAIAAAVDRLAAHTWRRLIFAESPTFVPLLRGWGDG